MASQLVYLVIFSLYMHACSARPFMIQDKENVPISSKVQDVKADEFMNPKAGHGEKIVDHATNIVHLDNRKLSSVQEDENIQGKKIKIPYTWKILQQVTRTEIWKRAERSTLESPAHKAEDAVESKNNDTAEDIEVMDYAQPHRKPPIHNKGT